VQVNAWIQEFSSAQGFFFCDTAKAVSDPKNPWKLARSPDGLHPDVEGYRKMGEALASVISKRNA